MSTFIERTLLAVSADDEEFEMSIRIGSPRASGQDWCCQVSVTRLFETPQELFGVDSWQAVQLSLQFVAQLLGDFVGRGGRLFWLGAVEPVNLADMFVRTDVPGGQ